MGHRQLKADPYGFGMEVPPKSASVVTDIDDYEWGVTLFGVHPELVLRARELAARSGPGARAT